MAGIGFELRKLLSKESYASLFQAYAYAGIISSGPCISETKRKPSMWSAPYVSPPTSSLKTAP